MENTACFGLLTDPESDIEGQVLGKRLMVSNNKNAPAPPKKMRKKEVEFEEKKKVAEEVCKYENIYDTSKNAYHDKSLEAATWQKIARSTGLDMDVCKRHWNSLKNSAKYYSLEVKVPYKSGVGADDPITEPKYRTEWSFKDVMSFYTPPNQRPTSTMVSITNPSEPLQVDSFTSIEPDLDENCSIYSYSRGDTSKLGKKDKLAENITKLTNSFSSFLEQRSRAPSETEVAKTKLKYHQMWANFDCMVSKLPEDDVDDLNIEIANLIGNRLKHNRERSKE